MDACSIPAQPGSASTVRRKPSVVATNCTSSSSENTSGPPSS